MTGKIEQEGQEGSNPRRMPSYSNGTGTVKKGNALVGQIQSVGGGS